MSAGSWGAASGRMRREVGTFGVAPWARQGVWCAYWGEYLIKARGRCGGGLCRLGRPEESAGDRGWSAGESAVRETRRSFRKGRAIWLNLPEEQANLED